MRWLSVFLYIGFAAYGMGFTFSPTIFSGFVRLQADTGDTILNHYFLEHSWRCVSQSDYVGTLWSPPFFYPEQDVLGYSDNLFGSAPIYWLLRCFFSELPAYQLWMMIGFILNFLAMAVVLRWFGLDHPLCALGAFLFAFGLPHVQQINHQQLIYRCWTPLALWYFWRFTCDPSGSRLFRCLFCIVWQVYAVIYVGWFVCLGIGVWGIVLSIGDREFRARLWRFVRERPFSAAAPVMMNGVLLAALVIPYMEANRGYRREFSEVLFYTPHWWSWLSVPKGTFWDRSFGSLLRDPITEGYLCGGLALFILGGLCFLPFRRTAGGDDRLLIRSAATSALLIFALSMSIWIDDDRGVTLWFGVYKSIPGAKAIRCVIRVYTILYPLLTIAGLKALQVLLRPSGRFRAIKIAFVGILILLAAVENYYPHRDEPGRSFAAEPIYWRARLLAEEIRGSNAAYGSCWLDCPDYEHQTTMMWAGLYANVPVVNGYSGRAPKDYPFEGEPFSIEALQSWVGCSWRGRFTVVANDDPPTRHVWIVDEQGEWKQVE